MAGVRYNTTFVPSGPLKVLPAGGTPAAPITMSQVALRWILSQESSANLLCIRSREFPRWTGPFSQGRDRRSESGGILAHSHRAPGIRKGVLDSLGPPGPPILWESREQISSQIQPHRLGSTSQEPCRPQGQVGFRWRSQPSSQLTFQEISPSLEPLCLATGLDC